MVNKIIKIRGSSGPKSLEEIRRSVEKLNAVASTEIYNDTSISVWLNDSVQDEALKKAVEFEGYNVNSIDFV